MGWIWSIKRALKLVPHKAPTRPVFVFFKPEGRRPTPICQ